MRPQQRREQDDTYGQQCHLPPTAPHIAQRATYGQQRHLRPAVPRARPRTCSLEARTRSLKRARPRTRGPKRAASKAQPRTQRATNASRNERPRSARPAAPRNRAPRASYSATQHGQQRQPSATQQRTPTVPPTSYFLLHPTHLPGGHATASTTHRAHSNHLNPHGPHTDLTSKRDGRDTRSEALCHTPAHPDEPPTSYFLPTSYLPTRRPRNREHHTRSAQQSPEPTQSTHGPHIQTRHTRSEALCHTPAHPDGTSNVLLPTYILLTYPAATQPRAPHTGRTVTT